MDTIPITLHVNGKARSLHVVPTAMLVDVLREDLHLTGTKNGCGQGHCGACTVIVNGKAIRSCIARAALLDGARVETIEGLAREDALHPVQASFMIEGAIQCGFCTPGMVMSVKALLDAHSNPTRTEIDLALDHNLCRCTGYGSILRAIRRASKAPPAEAWDPCLEDKETHAVGLSCVRPDAREKATGAATYAADLRFPGMLHAKVLRSQHAHARVLRVETGRARALPGVAAVLTAEDIPGARKNGHVRRDWPILVGQGETVRYMGDALALVAAESESVARAALALIEVDYQPLPGVFSAQEALAPGAPLLHADAPGNLLKHIPVHRGDMADGWSSATEVVEGEFTTPFIEHAFLEPEAGVAVPDPDGVTVYVGSQIPFDDRRVVAETLGLPLDKVRIIATAVGGAFGGKEDVSVQPLAALLARTTGRPVKLVFTRQESILVHPKRHATTIRIKVGASADGRLKAVEATILGDSGAYASLGEHVMTRTATHLAGPYVAPNVQVDCYAAYTNNPPAGAMRGFGVPQAAFAMESCMDMLAQRLGLHPLELRRRNALHVGSVTASGQVLTESVGLLETIDRVQTEVQRLGDDILAPSSPDRLRAWGFACCMKNVGFGGGARDAAGAEVVANPDGQVEVRIGAAEVGQGLMTVAAQIAAEELRVPYETVSVLVGDTGKAPDGGATTASRQTFVTGNAVRRAARQVRQLLDAGAGEGDRPVSASAEYVAPKTVRLGQQGDQHFAYGFATQAALVEVSKTSGQVKVLKVIAAHDVGRALNPDAVRGQVEGGVAMGVGFALTERLELDHGVTRNPDLRRYRVPRIDSAPGVTCILVEAPVSEGPYGAKGVGEITSIPTAPAITNAIFAATGLRVTGLPAILPAPLPDRP
jgi:selenium-dependent xanthine dehydrogenase